MARLTSSARDLIVAVFRADARRPNEEFLAIREIVLPNVVESTRHPGFEGGRLDNTTFEDIEALALEGLIRPVTRPWDEWRYFEITDRGRAEARRTLDAP